MNKTPFEMIKSELNLEFLEKKVDFLINKHMKRGDFAQPDFHNYRNMTQKKIESELLEKKGSTIPYANTSKLRFLQDHDSLYPYEIMMFNNIALTEKYMPTLYKFSKDETQQYTVELMSFEKIVEGNHISISLNQLANLEMIKIKITQQSIQQNKLQNIISFNSKKVQHANVQRDIDNILETAQIIGETPSNILKNSFILNRIVTIPDIEFRNTLIEHMISGKLLDPDIKDFYSLIYDFNISDINSFNLNSLDVFGQGLLSPENKIKSNIFKNNTMSL